MRPATAIGGTAALGALSLAAADLAREFDRAATARDALVVSLPAALLIAAVGLAALMVAIGWTRRDGHAPHCARCGYPFLDTDDELICACPECGAPWRWIGRTVEGRPSARPGLLTLGAAIGLGSVTLLFLGAAAPQALLRAAPEPVVVAHAAGMPWYASLESWRNVRERALSPQSAAWLAARLRAQQVRGRFVPYEAEEWLYDVTRGRGVAAPPPAPAAPVTPARTR